MSGRFIRSAGAMAVMAACSGPQSALEPRGDQASEVAVLGWILFAGAAAIFIIVVVLTLRAVIGPAERRATVGGQWLIVSGGIVFPVFVLTGLLLYAFSLAAGLTRTRDDDALRIEVIGRMWWWDVRYAAEGVITANEIRIPVGRPVELTVSSVDVIHSFWVPSLAGKVDMIPGKSNRLRFTADRAGVYRGQCAEFCGTQHARMAFHVVAQAPETFAAWLAGQSRPARQPDTPFLERGRALFVESGCGTCHTIRGLPADGRFGPDLTHVASRHSIGAGVLPNNVGTLAGWIADSQTLKPGNPMPAFNVFSGQELRALAAYLASLQ